MAIIFHGLSTCAVCNGILQKDEVVLGFPHFIVDDKHPLWRFSDSAMHKACFATWVSAEDFRAAFNTLWPLLMPNHKQEMQADGTIVDL